MGGDNIGMEEMQRARQKVQDKNRKTL